MIDFLADPIETGQLHAMLDQHGVKSPYNTMFFSKIAAYIGKIMFAHDLKR